MTYLLLSSVMSLGVFLVLWQKKMLRWNKNIAFTLIVLLVLTAVFDSIIIGVGIVAYDSATLMGVYVGHAPLEDFFYALVVVFLAPAVWSASGRKYART
jgi:lycopene cyclase domain-containing protein